MPVVVLAMPYYVYADHINTPRVITRASDNVMVWRWDHADPFGVALPNENPAGVGGLGYNLRFPGQVFDAESGFHYNYFRDYSPLDGRYHQSDPIRLQGGVNTYAYLAGNPVSYVESFGLETSVTVWKPVGWGESSAGAVFFIDLDHFKQLNDSRGHDVGDLLLTAVSQRLLDAVRMNDTVARQGGDEFVILMGDLGHCAEEAAQQASQLGEKLRNALAHAFDFNGVEYYCKTSIGVSLFQGHDTASTLLKHADLALYQAKGKGRDRLQFFDPLMQAELEHRNLIEADLRLAVPLGQLRLYYQSQVDVTRRVVGMEALLRWEHPQYGLLQPEDFIPLAEDTGLILPLGRWVLDMACAQIKAWELDPVRCNLQVAVNVSARQFRQVDFVAQIHTVVQVYAINPTRLKLELTESMVLEDIADAIKKMQAVKQLGVQFAMDDFGIGYSSLSYLAQLPLDQIKIDKSFVCNLPGIAKDETIAKAIINMGLGLNLNVIAEGVETEFQCKFLAAHGCHAYQGFLFGAPMPITSFK